MRCKMNKFTLLETLSTSTGCNEMKNDSIGGGFIISDYMSQSVAPKFAPTMYGWLSVGLRLPLGQLHKSLFYSHMSFIHKYLQTTVLD